MQATRRTHVVGEAFVRAYVARHGVAALHSLLAGAALPGLAEIEQVVAAGVSPAWTDPTPMAELMEARLGLKRENAAFTRQSPYRLVRVERDAKGAPFEAINQVAVYYRTNTRRSVAMAFLLSSEAGAEAMVEGRRTALQEFETGTTVFTTAAFYERKIRTVLPLVGPLRPPGSGATIDFRAKVGGNEWYSEVWAQKGRVVAAVTWEGIDVGYRPGAVLADILALDLPQEMPRIEDDADAMAILDRYAPR